MAILQLQFRDSHIFVVLNDELWLVDTGASTSFGTPSELSIAGEQFKLGTSHQGLTADMLSQFVGVPCVGLIGADILGRFDHIFDVAGGTLTISASELSLSGQRIRLTEFTGVPIVTARIGARDYRMFFDTGAQISYLQDGSLANWPSAGSMTDFYPGFGRFETETYEVQVSLGGVTFTLRCGTLPDSLGSTLMMANTVGIIGNAILANQSVGYFPRRRVFVL